MLHTPLTMLVCVCGHTLLIQLEHKFFLLGKKKDNLSDSQRTVLYTQEEFSVRILIKTKINSKILQKKLLKKNILIRDCSTFCGLNENYVRIAVKNRKENQILIKN